jgi:hypothetical protein
MDFREDSMIAETVAQCSYNTAYKALVELEAQTPNWRKWRILDVVMQC